MDRFACRLWNCGVVDSAYRLYGVIWFGLKLLWKAFPVWYFPVPSRTLCSFPAWCHVRASLLFPGKISEKTKKEKERKKRGERNERGERSWSLNSWVVSRSTIIRLIEPRGKDEPFNRDRRNFTGPWKWVEIRSRAASRGYKSD